MDLGDDATTTTNGHASHGPARSAVHPVQVTPPPAMPPVLPPAGAPAPASSPATGAAAAAAAPAPGLVQLGMLAQLESLYAERERLTQALGTSDADDVVEVVAALRTEVESWRRLVELMEAQRRLDAERDAVQAELRRLQEAVGLVGVEVS